MYKSHQNPLVQFHKIINKFGMDFVFCFRLVKCKKDVGNSATAVGPCASGKDSQGTE